VPIVGLMTLKHIVGFRNLIPLFLYLRPKFLQILSPSTLCTCSLLSFSCRSFILVSAVSLLWMLLVVLLSLTLNFLLLILIPLYDLTIKRMYFLFVCLFVCFKASSALVALGALRVCVSPNSQVMLVHGPCLGVAGVRQHLGGRPEF
jgi:hypothetical protein